MAAGNDHRGRANPDGAAGGLHIDSTARAAACGRMQAGAAMMASPATIRAPIKDAPLLVGERAPGFFFFPPAPPTRCGRRFLRERHGQQEQHRRARNRRSDEVPSRPLSDS